MCLESEAVQITSGIWMFEPCCRNKLKLQVIMTIAIVITIIVTIINYLNSIIIIVTFSVTYVDVWEFSLIGTK